MDTGIEQMMCVEGTKQRVERQRGWMDSEAKKGTTLKFSFLCGKTTNQCNLVITEQKTPENENLSSLYF